MKNHVSKGLKIAAVVLLSLLSLFNILVITVSHIYPLTFGLTAILIVLVLLLYLAKTRIKRRSIRQNTGLLILSLGTVIFVLELVLIFTGSFSTYTEKRVTWYYESRYRENTQGHLYLWKSDHYLETNEFSFFRSLNPESLSDKTHPLFKPKNEFRILALGDSFTEGDGAAADSTWLKFLEYSLRKKPLAKQLRYINAGVCGSDPFFEYMLLKTKLLKYKPDLVILCINSSDIEDIRIRGGWERFKADGTVIYNNPPWWEPLYAGFRFLRPAFHLAGYNELLLKEVDPDSLDAETKVHLLSVISSFRQLAKESGFRLLLVFHPTRSEIDAGHAPWSDLARSEEQNTAYDVLDLLQYFKVTGRVEPENSYLYYWPHDGHHNSRGYAAFAEGVEWKLLQTGISDSLINR